MYQNYKNLRRLDSLNNDNNNNDLPIIANEVVATENFNKHSTVDKSHQTVNIVESLNGDAKDTFGEERIKFSQRKIK